MKNNYETIDWSQWARLLVKNPPIEFMNGQDVIKYINDYDGFSKKLIEKMPFLKTVLPRIIKRDLNN